MIDWESIALMFMGFSAGLLCFTIIFKLLGWI